MQSVLVIIKTLSFNVASQVAVEEEDKDELIAPEKECAELEAWTEEKTRL